MARVRLSPHRLDFVIRPTFDKERLLSERSALQRQKAALELALSRCLPGARQDLRSEEMELEYQIRVLDAIMDPRDHAPAHETHYAAFYFLREASALYPELAASLTAVPVGDPQAPPSTAFVSELSAWALRWRLAKLADGQLQPSEPVTTVAAITRYAWAQQPETIGVWSAPVLHGVPDIPWGFQLPSEPRPETETLEECLDRIRQAYLAREQQLKAAGFAVRPAEKELEHFRWLARRAIGHESPTAIGKSAGRGAKNSHHSLVSRTTTQLARLIEIEI